MQSDLYGSWLEQVGVSVPRRDDGGVDGAIEISPLTAMRGSDLEHVELPSELIRSGNFTC